VGDEGHETVFRIACFTDAGIAEIKAKRDFSLNVALRCSSSPPVRARGFGMWRFIVEAELFFEAFVLDATAATGG
jgi:hypothetical protein